MNILTECVILMIIGAIIMGIGIMLGNFIWFLGACLTGGGFLIFLGTVGGFSGERVLK